MAENKYTSVYERFKQNTAQQPVQQQSAIVGALGVPDAPDGTPQVQAQAQASKPRSYNSVYDLYGQNKMNDFSAGAPKQAKAANPVAAKPVLGQTPGQDPNDIPVQIPDDIQEPEDPINTDLPALNPTPSVAKPATQIDNSKPPEPPAEPKADVPPESGKGGGAPSAPRPPGGGGGFGGGAPRPPSPPEPPSGGGGGGGYPDSPNVPMPDVPWPETPPKTPEKPPEPPTDDDVVIDPDTGEPLIDPITGDFVRAGKNDSVGVDPDTFRPDGTVLKGDKPSSPFDIPVDIGGDFGGSNDYVGPGGPDPYFDPVTDDGGYGYEEDPYADDEDQGDEEDQPAEGEDPNDWRTYMGGPSANHGSPVSADWNGSYMEVTFSDGYKRPAII